jgi:hypothetical protein
MEDQDFKSPDIGQGPMFNRIHGDYSGESIISREESYLPRHNPLKARSIEVDLLDLSLEEDISGGASINL